MKHARLNHGPAELFGGVDNLFLDDRTFNPSRDDIENICRFFATGRLLRFEKEKGITISHSNFFAFAETGRGRHALKFYPSDAAKTITIEYALNRLLTRHRFPTPLMHAGKNGLPFIAASGRLAACYSYIDATPLWKHIEQRDIIRQTNTALLSLKNILSQARRIPLLPQENLGAIASDMTRASRQLSPYDQEKTINAVLLEACRAYKHNQALFTRHALHNNASLTNFLVHREKVYMLDLSHVRRDYVLSDLASLIISCILFDVPSTTINAITKDYLAQHQTDPEHLTVLNSLVQLGLVKEYLKNVQREKAVKLPAPSEDLTGTYLAHLSQRKGSIVTALETMDVHYANQRQS